ncbi:hypothetical protein PGT21_005555 [Puccinia graminis f. sp. tritici]|uniref:Uncharacterized protein n=1 Tax=Puccinia graminis f. sp. tritici TaxID=56615 RepID=A0A5B0M5Y2_PUCGR|nr:hypothetical protein PGT21_005555 [Puccinia graminis f. sp. tritici]
MANIDEGVKSSFCRFLKLRTSLVLATLQETMILSPFPFETTSARHVLESALTRP